MLCPFVPDSIVAKVECEECLCEKCIWSRERRLEDDVHSVDFESIGQMFCPLVSDLTVSKVESGECLFQKCKRSKER